LAYVLNTCPDDLTTHPLFTHKLLPTCIEILEASKYPKREHIILLEGLLPFTHLVPLESQARLSEKFSDQVLLSFFHNNGLLAKGSLLRYQHKKTGSLASFSTIPFIEIFHEPLENLLKLFTILKAASLFDHLPGLELQITNLIKLKVSSGYNQSKVLIHFLSTQYSPKARSALTELISECLPLCLRYYDVDATRFRTLLALYFDSDKWFEYAESSLRTSETGDCTGFLANNYTTVNNVNGLVYLSKISKSKQPFNLVSLIFLLMHPYAWTL